MLVPTVHDEWAATNQNDRYYAPVIFQQSVGLPRDISLLLAGFNGIAYFISSLVPIWIIDRLGRRKLMLFAAGGQAVCMAILAGTVSNGSKSAGIVAVVMLFLFNFFFAVVYSPFLGCFLLSTRLSLLEPELPLWLRPRTGSSLSLSSRSPLLVSRTSSGGLISTLLSLTPSSCR